MGYPLLKLLMASTMIRISASHEKEHPFTRDLEEKTQVLDRGCGLYA